MVIQCCSPQQWSKLRHWFDVNNSVVGGHSPSSNLHHLIPRPFQQLALNRLQPAHRIDLFAQHIGDVEIIYRAFAVSGNVGGMDDQAGVEPAYESDPIAQRIGNCSPEMAALLSPIGQDKAVHRPSAAAGRFSRI